MKHGAKNRSNTRKILNNNNVYTLHTGTHTRMHAPTHRPHTLFFWLTNNLKHSINYNKTKFLKQCSCCLSVSSPSLCELCLVIKIYQFLS